MKILKVGDTQRTACNNCESFQDVTFQLRNINYLSDRSEVVRDVIVGVCDACDSVIVLPHQSVSTIKK
jgi:hypothetical protein